MGDEFACDEDWGFCSDGNGDGVTWAAIYGFDGSVEINEHGGNVGLILDV